MKNLHILIPRHYDFSKTHFTEIWLNSIYDELSKHFSIKITWILYHPKKKYVHNLPNNENVEFIQDFNNAIEILEKLKPDLILSSEYPSLIDLAFHAASKNFNSIFVKTLMDFSMLPVNSKQKIISKTKLRSTIPLLSSLSLLFSTNNYAVFDRFSFLWYKFKFLFSTLFFSNLRFKEKWNFLSAGLSYLLNPKMIYFNPKLFPDIELCNSLILSEFLKQNNYFHSGLHVVGVPIYDNFFKKRNQIQNKTSLEKIKVLLAPTGFYNIETAQKQTEDSVISITKIMSQFKSKFDFFIKLHPSTHNYDEYEKYAHTIDKSVPIFQEGSIESHIERSDVVIIFTVLTSALIYPLILHKPVILCNFANELLPVGIDDLIFVCTDPSDLKNTIIQSINTNHIKYQKIDEYLEQSCFKTDGLASKRIVDIFVSMIKTKS